MPHPESKLLSVDAPSRLLSGFRGDQGALSALYLETKDRLKARARRKARDFPVELLDDVVGETWLIVMERGEVAVSRAAVPDYLYLVRVLPHAIQRVRSANRVPGSKSRGKSAVSSETFDLENVAHQNAEAAVTIERFDEAAELSAAREAIESALAKASPKVRSAATLMLLEDANISEASRAVGINRMTLTRALALLGKAA